ncbi:hypothetical protein WDU94_000906 [Cyamophila willieti]
MDPALLKERDLFNKKAISTATVVKKKHALSSRTVQKKKSKTSQGEPGKTKKPKTNCFPSSVLLGSGSDITNSSQYNKFLVLTKIIELMKRRHQNGLDYPLNIDEILFEINMENVGNKIKTWLSREALQNNPKIDVIDETKFLYKPVFQLKGREGLLKLLKQQDLKGTGGILLNDVSESLPHCEEVLKHPSLEKEIIYVGRRKVMFYNDKSAQLDVDETLQKLWHSVSVGGMDNDKIEEYFKKQGIRPCQDTGFKKPIMRIMPRRKKTMHRKAQLPRTNDHIHHLLEY